MSKNRIEEILSKRQQIEAEYQENLKEEATIKEQRAQALQNLYMAYLQGASIKLYERMAGEDTFTRKHRIVQLTSPYDNASKSLLVRDPDVPFLLDYVQSSMLDRSKAPILLDERYDIVQDNERFTISAKDRDYLLETTPMRGSVFCFRQKMFASKHYKILGYTRGYGETSVLNLNDIELSEAFNDDDCIVVKANTFEQAFSKALQKGLKRSYAENVVKITHINGEVQYRKYEFSKIYTNKIPYLANMEEDITLARVSLLEWVFHSSDYAQALAKRFNVGLSQLASELQEGRITFFATKPYKPFLELIRFPDENFKESELYARYIELIGTKNTTQNSNGEVV